MIIALNPYGIWVVWLDDNIGVVDISPIAGFNKTGVGIDIAEAPLGLTSWRYIVLVSACPILDTIISNVSKRT